MKVLIDKTVGRIDHTDDLGSASGGEYVGAAILGEPLNDLSE